MRISMTMRIGKDCSSMLFIASSVRISSSICNSHSRVSLLVSRKYATTSISEDDAHFLKMAEKIATVVKAANLKIESYWPGLFAQLFEKRNIEDLILNVGSGGAPIAVANPAAETGSAAAAASGPGTDEKKEEASEKGEEEDDGFSLFD